MMELPCPSKRIASTAAYTSSGESWSSDDCVSERKSGRYADYHTFELDSAQTVAIHLDSSLDNFLYLTKGPHERGELVDYDRKSGPDNDAQINDAQIEEVLEAGIYTIEATVHPSGKRPGQYPLKVKELQCENPTDFQVRRTGAGTANLTWTAPDDSIAPTGYNVSVHRWSSGWVWNDTMRPASTATSVTDSGLVGSSWYKYKFWTQCGSSKYSSGSHWLTLRPWTGASISKGRAFVMWVEDGIVDLLVVALLAISIPFIIIVGIAIRVCVKRGVHADIIAPFACFILIAALAAIIGWHFFLFGVGIYGEVYVLFYLGWIIAVIAGSVPLTSLVARRFGRLVSPPSEPSESESA